MRIIPFPELVRGLGGRDEAGKILASFSITINPDVETFLHDKIFDYEESHATRSYFAIDEEMNILGFYSLAIATYQITGRTPEDLKEKLRGINNTNRKLIPGILIGQLARFDGISKESLPGSLLMENALERIDAIHKEIGLRFVWLDCADEKGLKDFYAQFGFSEINKDRYCQMMAFFEEKELN